MQGRDGTLALATSPLSLSLSTGLTATVDPLTVSAAAVCGRNATLGGRNSPGRVSLSDGSVLTASQISADASSPASATLGKALCLTHDVICELSELLAHGGSVAAVIAKLNQLLARLGVL